MLHPAPMQKVRIIALKSQSEELIRKLHEAGLMEIRKSKADGLDAGRPMPFFDEVSSQLVRLRGVMSIIESSSSGNREYEPKIIDGQKALEKAKSIDYNERLKKLFDEENRLKEEISSYSDYLNTAKNLQAFRNVDFSKLKSRILDFRVGEMPEVNIDKLEKKLGQILKDFSLSSPETSGNVPVLLIFRKKDGIDLDPMLGEAGFSALPMPPGMTKPSIAISQYHNEIRSRENRMNELRSEITGLADSVYPEIRNLIDSLEVAAERSEISSRFAFSSKAIIIHGWIRQEKYDDLKKIANDFGGEVIMERVEPEKGEMPPTVLENPRQAGPFEFLTRNYSFPNAHEIDPSLIYMFFVPILYGMIVGDVVYGIISIFIAKFLMDKFRNSNTMYNVANLWYISAFPTIIFGVIFDEWFGMSHMALLGVLAQWGLPVAADMLYEGFHRDHHLTTLIGITALVGLIQLGVGFILGAINHWNHHRKHAYAKLAWLGIEIGGSIAVAALILNLLPAEYGLYGEVLFVASVIALFFTEGIAGILEIPGLMGNVLSYARIAAIGIVGVILAKIINSYFVPLPEQGIFVLLFIPLFVALHSANAFIAMFEALIQGGRLNLLEFRSKFVEGGGSEFKPFSLRSKN